MSTILALTSRHSSATFFALAFTLARLFGALVARLFPVELPRRPPDRIVPVAFSGLPMPRYRLG